MTTRDPVNSPGRRCVFVLGVTQRTGTHFAEGFLSCHPGVIPAPDRGFNERWTFEHFLLAQAPLLARYVEQIQRRWPTPWSVDVDAERTMLAAIGRGVLDGLFRYLHVPDDGSLVAIRAPSAESLPLLPLLFPDSKAIVTIRHPAAVAQSGADTFGKWRRSLLPAWQTWALGWAAGVQQFLAAADTVSPSQLLGVRYEDLLRVPGDMGAVVSRFLELDPAAFDSEAARSLPARGSSTQKARHGKVTWAPEAATAVDDPLARGSDWPATQLRQLQALCSDELGAMGYEPVAPLPRSRRLLLQAPRTWWKAEGRALSIYRGLRLPFREPELLPTDART